MNPAITELHAKARQNELLADADVRRPARQARVQRSTRVTQDGTLTALASWLGRAGNRRLVEVPAA